MGLSCYVEMCSIYFTQMNQLLLLHASQARLLKDTAAAAAELGISTSNIDPGKTATTGMQGAAAAAGEGSSSAAAPLLAAAAAGGGPRVRSGTVLTAVENTDKVHNLIVCTLCSCYPLSVLGMSPPWYKSKWVGMGKIGLLNGRRRGREGC